MYLLINKSYYRYSQWPMHHTNSYNVDFNLKKDPNGPIKLTSKRCLGALKCNVCGFVDRPTQESSIKNPSNRCTNGVHGDAPFLMTKIECSCVCYWYIYPIENKVILIHTGIHNHPFLLNPKVPRDKAEVTVEFYNIHYVGIEKNHSVES